jgi:U-box domain
MGPVWFCGPSGALIEFHSLAGMYECQKFYTINLNCRRYEVSPSNSNSIARATPWRTRPGTQQPAGDEIEGEAVQSARRTLTPTHPAGMASRESAEIGVKSLLECPISLELSNDPVTLLESGITYDRASLSESLQRYPDLEPTTGQRFGQPLHFVANSTLRRIVELVRADTEASTHPHVSAPCASAIKALLLCPLSQKTIEDPVVVHESGVVYDRKALCAALVKQPDMASVTGQRLTPPVKFTPCITVRNLIRLLHGESQLRIESGGSWTPPASTRNGQGDPPGAPARVRGASTRPILDPPPAVPAALHPPAPPVAAVPAPPAAAAAAPAGRPPDAPAAAELIGGALTLLLFYYLFVFVAWLFQ